MNAALARLPRDEPIAGLGHGKRERFPGLRAQRRHRPGRAEAPAGRGAAANTRSWQAKWQTAAASGPEYSLASIQPTSASPRELAATAKVKAAQSEPERATRSAFPKPAPGAARRTITARPSP